MGRTEKRIDRANWASLKPFGIGEQKPNNYLELWRAFRENRRNAAYAWRQMVLNPVSRVPLRSSVP